MDVYAEPFRASAPFDLPFLRWLPRGYADDPARRWPLIVALHGSDERGTDLSAVTRHGLARRLSEGLDLPAVVIAPQCPPDRWWDVEPVAALVRHAVGTFRVDPSRVVLTGQSMGGFGTWHVGTRYPHLFAGLMPICGGGLAWLAPQIADARVPVWAWHGLLDEVVAPYHSREMTNALRAAGGDARLTELPEVAHNAWDAAYDNSDALTWLTSQRRAI